jgi:hypothetical protein
MRTMIRVGSLGRPLMKDRRRKRTPRTTILILPMVTSKKPGSSRCQKWAGKKAVRMIQSNTA